MCKCYFNVTLKKRMEFKCARSFNVTLKTWSLNVQGFFYVTSKHMEFKCARFFNVTFENMEFKCARFV